MNYTIEEKLDLENPIFLVYIDVDGLTNQSARDKFESIRKHLNYSNATMWYIADKFNKIELIWKGSKSHLIQELQILKDSLLELIKLLR